MNNSMGKCERMSTESGNVILEECKTNEGAYMSKRRVAKNLAALCLGFIFLFSAFMALANLQSTMNNAGSIGGVSQSAIYGALIISSLFLPKLVIKKIGCKRTILFSILTYSPYIAANFSPKTSTLLPTAVLLGTGAGTLWSSTSTYINELSFLYVNEDSDKAAASTSTFFGIFLMCFQSTQIWGNIASFFVLRSANGMEFDVSPADNQSNTTPHADIFTCGVNFCGDVKQAVKPVPDAKRFTLVGIYLVFSLMSAIVVGVFVDSLKREEPIQDAKHKTILKLVATFKQMIKVDQLLLVVLSTYSGLQQGFLFRDYTQAYVACAWGLQNVGLVFVCYGVVNAIISVWCGRLAKFMPRTVLMTVAATSNIGVCIELFTWRPDRYHPSTFLIIVGFWAFSDAIWQTQLSALYGVLFRSDAEAAFANYRLWEAVGYLIAFGCSSVLCTSSKIYMQIGFLIAGMMGYIAVELRTFRRKKCYLVTNPMQY